MAVPRRRGGDRGIRVCARADYERTRADRRARGVPRGVADLGPRRRLRCAALRARRASARTPRRRPVRVDVGVLHHGIERRGTHRRADPVDGHVAAVHGVDRRRRDHRDVHRRAATPAGRRPPGAVQDGGARAAAAAGGHHPGDRQALRRALCRPDGARDRGPRRAGVDERRSADGSVQRGGARIRDDCDRRVLARAAIDRAVRGGHAMDDRGVHAGRRNELRAAVCGLRDQATTPARAQTKRSGSAPPCWCWHRRSSSSSF